MRSRTRFHVTIKISQILYKDFTAFFSFMQYLSTADIDAFIRSLRILLDVAIPVRKTLTTNDGQMQRRRHYMTADGF